MGEKRPQTVAALAKSLSPVQRRALETGLTGHAVYASFNKTIDVLHRHGLIDRLLIVTDLGRAVLKLIIDDPDVDALHQQALELDHDRTVMMRRERAPLPQCLPGCARTDRKYGNGSSVHVPDCPEWAELAEKYPDDAPRFFHSPLSRVMPQVARLLPTPRTSTPTRPAIVDQITGGGPAYPHPTSPGNVMLPVDAYNELRDYLQRQQPTPDIDARIIRRAQYDALRAVRRELHAWQRQGEGLSPEVQARGRIAAEAFREMIDEAARKLNLPTTANDV